METILSTAYFPPIAQYAWLLQNAPIVIELFESFPKQTYRNRCEILTSHGVQVLSVPVVKVSGTNTLTRDIQIAYDTPWQMLHWKAIKTAYNSSPFFLFYQDEIAEFFSTRFETLLDLNDAIINLINQLMEWEISTNKTVDFLFPKKLADVNDKRYLLTPKKKPTYQFPSYIQVFSDQYPFQANLSILDLIFNLGPEAESYLMKLSV
ncbi:MAG: WbqC family protein [Bacteroidales bacterium]|nr:WbqC family protein [Bacteroidales bacterium]